MDGPEVMASLAVITALVALGERIRIAEMQREARRLERHIDLYRMCVALGHPTTVDGCWPNITTSRVTNTTAFIPAPHGEYADDISTGDLDRLEVALEVR